jgi:hypothetical protein
MGAPLDLSGKRFGKLLVIDKTDSADYGSYTKARWNCICDCGRKRTVQAVNLKSGGTKSCGICVRPGTNAKPDTAFEDLWHIYIKNAEYRGHVWGLNKEQFRELTKSPCHYTGRQPSHVQKSAATARRLKEGKDPLPGGLYVYNGIDRVDNSKGYTLDNCVPCCGEVNQMKMAFGHDEFIALCKEVAARH